MDFPDGVGGLGVIVGVTVIRVGVGVVRIAVVVAEEEGVAFLVGGETVREVALLGAELSEDACHADALFDFDDCLAVFAEAGQGFVVVARVVLARGDMFSMVGHTLQEALVDRGIPDQWVATVLAPGFDFVHRETVTAVVVPAEVFATGEFEGGSVGADVAEDGEEDANGGRRRIRGLEFHIDEMVAIGHGIRIVCTGGVTEEREEGAMFRDTKGIRGIDR